VLARDASLVSLGICGLAATAEGMLGGKRPMESFASLRLPRCTPPPWAWIIIGTVYYVICFTVLARLLQMDGSNKLQYFATVLMIVLLALNASFNLLLFRLRNVVAALLIFVPYDLAAVALLISLSSLDKAAAYIFVPYIAYLVFANVWGYHLWRLN
jgi:benzodiazapine receptor